MDKKEITELVEKEITGIKYRDYFKEKKAEFELERKGIKIIQNEDGSVSVVR